MSPREMLASRTSSGQKKHECFLWTSCSCSGRKSQRGLVESAPEGYLWGKAGPSRDCGGVGPGGEEGGLQLSTKEPTGERSPENAHRWGGKERLTPIQLTWAKELPSQVLPKFLAHKSMSYNKVVPVLSHYILGRFVMQTRHFEEPLKTLIKPWPVAQLEHCPHTPKGCGFNF